jgi:hypothetical protein
MNNHERLSRKKATATEIPVIDGALTHFQNELPGITARPLSKR